MDSHAVDAVGRNRQQPQNTRGLAQATGNFSMNILQYVCGTLWALMPSVFNAMTELVLNHAAGVRYSVEEIQSRISASPTLNARQPGRASAGNGVAVIYISGVIARHAGQVNAVSQPQGTSVEQVRQEIRAAIANDSVSQILLVISSPGGSVDGLTDLAAEIYACPKPVTAFADGLMCSAAYWLGCQAKQISATADAMVGSIGVLTVATDLSAQASQQGAKVHVVSTGGMKGKGYPGTAIDPECLAEMQRTVDTIGGMFVADVARGRRISAQAARGMADGRIHIGEAAKAAGFVDRIETLDDVIARLQGGGATSSGTRAVTTASLSANESEMLNRIRAEQRELAAKYTDPVQALAALSGGAIVNERQPMQATLPPPAPTLSATEQFSASFEANLKTYGGDRTKAMRATVAANESLRDRALAEQLSTTPAFQSRGPKPLSAAASQFTAIFEANLAACGNRAKAMSKTVSENSDLHQQMLASL